MPFRSPKRNFFIFGFHRLVWCPKCTPASSSSFIVTSGIDSSPSSVHPPPSSPLPSFSPVANTSREIRRRVYFLLLRPTFSYHIRRPYDKPPVSASDSWLVAGD